MDPGGLLSDGDASGAGPCGSLPCQLSGLQGGGFSANKTDKT